MLVALRIDYISTFEALVASLLLVSVFEAGK